MSKTVSVLRRPKSQATFSPDNVLREPGGGISKTVPNKALSVQTIITRFSSGQALPSVLDMEFTGDNTMPDLRTLDLVERANLHRYLKDHIAATDKELKEKLRLRRDAQVKDRERLNAALQYIEAQSKASVAGGNDKA